MTPGCEEFFDDKDAATAICDLFFDNVIPPGLGEVVTIILVGDDGTYVGDAGFAVGSTETL